MRERRNARTKSEVEMTKSQTPEWNPPGIVGDIVDERILMGHGAGGRKMQEVGKPYVHNIDLRISAQSLDPVISVMLLAYAPTVGKWLDFLFCRCASGDNLHLGDVSERRHMIHVVDEAATDYTHSDLPHRSESSRVLTGF